MSNRVDFFQSAQTQLVLPAGSVTVWVEGRLCPYLEVVEIVRGSWPEFGWAKLAFNPAAYDADTSVCAEDIEAEAYMGALVCIQRFYNENFPGSKAFGLTVFAGHVEQISSSVTGEGEKVEIKARDYSVNLEHVSVYGRRVENSDGSTFLIASCDTIFNENGQANATALVIERDGKSCRLFAANPEKGSPWNYTDVIRYLLCEYVSGGRLSIPSLERLEGLTRGEKVHDLDLTGLSLIEGLQRCSEKVGLKFKFVPRLTSDGPEQAIVFYKPDCGREVELNCQPAGEQFSISETNTTTLHSKKNFWPVTHKYIGQGDYKVYEATFELVKAWDGVLEDTYYDKFCPSTNPQFTQVKDVYRKWCLNEAGDYSGAPYNQGPAFDFSKVFDGEGFVCRRRRFWPALSTDSQHRSLGYFLEVSFDDGWHWWQYLHAFNNLLDECGIWLSSDQLDVDTWVAALKGALRFRITASVVGDERLNCAVAEGPVDSTIPVLEHLYTLPRQFKYCKVSSQSVFANSADVSVGRPNEVDDSVKLYQFVRQKSQSHAPTIETAWIETPYLALDYDCGDVVTCSPESRDLLGCRSDNRSVRWIERVRMDFKRQCTELSVIRQRRILL